MAQESHSHSKDQNAGLLSQTEENQNGEIRREKELKEKGNTEGIKVKENKKEGKKKRRDRKLDNVSSRKTL